MAGGVGTPAIALVALTALKLVAVLAEASQFQDLGEVCAQQFGTSGLVTTRAHRALKFVSQMADQVLDTDVLPVGSG